MKLAKIFHRSEIDFFQALSFDSNPLHMDEGYSRQTQFGKPVVFGIYSVLVALNHWANGRSFWLKTLQTDFKKPLFLNEPYALSWNEKDDLVEIQYRKGKSLISRISFQYEIQPQPWNNQTSQVFHPISRAGDFPYENRSNLSYSLNWNVASGKNSEVSQLFLSAPLHQLNALAWSSYYVGMVCPGIQALYSGFQFEFEKPCTSSEAFQINSLDTTFDERFNQIRLTGKGTGIRSFEIEAFKRPKPVVFGIDDILKVIPPSQTLKTTTALITGSSRGFGSVLAKAFGTQGAKVLLNYYSTQTQAEEIIQAISPYSETPLLIQGDMASQSDCKKMVETLLQRQCIPNLLILNASPQIHAKAFSDQTSEEWLTFVNQSLKMCLEPCLQLLPLMPAKSSVVLVSSVYTQNAEQLFSHYVSAKLAAEGLMKSLSKEYKNLNFIVARPPKMLTDQTNLVLPQNSIKNPIDIAANLLKYLQIENTNRNYTELNL